MTKQPDGNLDEPEEPVNNELADLVAYLDGELEISRANGLEQRLAEDEPLRKQADQLDRAWQLLDSLEEITASGQFTNRTLESMQSISLAETETGFEPDLSATSQNEVVLRNTRSTAWSHVLARTAISFSFSFVLCFAVIETVEWNRLRNRPPDDVELLRHREMLEGLFLYDLPPNTEFLKDLPTPKQVESTGG
ncbi:MAG: hypothetical protein R3C20_16650 [Planctomycetaceae bacterium]